MGEDPELVEALTLGAIALEMRERFDIIAAAVFFEGPWPHGEFLPVKRPLPIGGELALGETPVIECGMVRCGDGATVTVANDVRITYASFERMAEAGWRPD